MRNQHLFSGNNIQLPPHENDPLRNIFAKQTNKNIFQRLFLLKSFKYEFQIQQRTIPVISDMISLIWYQNFIKSTVN